MGHLNVHMLKQCGDKSAAKSSIRRRVDTWLDGLNDKDLLIIEAVAKAIHKAKEQD